MLRVESSDARNLLGRHKVVKGKMPRFDLLRQMAEDGAGGEVALSGYVFDAFACFVKLEGELTGRDFLFFRSLVGLFLTGSGRRVFAIAEKHIDASLLKGFQFKALCGNVAEESGFEAQTFKQIFPHLLGTLGRFFIVGG